MQGQDYWGVKMNNDWLDEDYDVLEDIQPEDFVFVVDGSGQLKGISWPENLGNEVNLVTLSKADSNNASGTSSSANTKSKSVQIGGNKHDSAEKKRTFIQNRPASLMLQGFVLVPCLRNKWLQREQEQTKNGTDQFINT